jgi:hypothetical protein
MLDHDLKALPVTKPIRLRNVICPYCGAALTHRYLAEFDFRYSNRAAAWRK